jgi:hypothetical protein
MESVFHCVIIPPDNLPECSSGLFEDAVQEQATRRRCMSETHFDETGYHFIFHI